MQNNGNVLSQKITVKRPSQSDLVFDQLYTYDTLNRITSAEEKTGTTVNWNQTYTFDRYGNRNFNESLTTTLPKGCMDGSTPVVCEADKNIFDPDLNPANNRMATGQGWTYDAAGNVITDPEGRTFTYDAENKQTEVENSSSQTIGEYFFDGDGKRVKKYVPSTGEVTIFIYDAGAKLIGEYSTIVETQDPKVQYLTNDHLGSPRINTDQNGNVISRTDYLPYGEEIIALGNRTANENYVADDVRQGFTGYENDNETGLDFAQARMFNSSIGRFSTTDPILMSTNRRMNPQEINLYAYVRNNPLNLVDPLGEEIGYAGKNQKERDANREYYDNYVKYVNGLPDDNPDKARLLATIKQLEESSVTYLINVTTDIGRGGKVEGQVIPDSDGNNIMVNIRNLGNNHEQWSMNSRFAHELRHAQQFDDGEIGFYKDSKSGEWRVTPGSIDSWDEVDAYKDSVAIGATNGADNMNSRLRGIITGMRNANGDRAKELEAFRIYKKLDPEDVIRQNKIVNFPNQPRGLQRFNSPSGDKVFVCNGGCPRKKNE